MTTEKSLPPPVIELPADFWDWTGARVIDCDNLELRSIVIECVG